MVLHLNRLEHPKPYTQKRLVVSIGVESLRYAYLTTAGARLFCWLKTLALSLNCGGMSG